MLNLIFVDNPLADPFDAGFIGFHAAHQADVTIKCMLRQHVEEQVGVMAEDDQGRIRVVEYSEISPEDLAACNPDLTFKYPYANSGLFCFNADFFQKISKEQLPWHLAHKAVQQTTPNAWKFERFIFDCLLFTKLISLFIHENFVLLP